MPAHSAVLLCLATAALRVSWRPPSLTSAEVDSLVARRTHLRSLRKFAAADGIKERLESAGVQLQDEVGGGTLWQFAPAPLEPDLEIGQLGRQAALLAEAGDSTAAEVNALAAAAEARCAEGAALLGRSAADAAFDFAIAGVDSGVVELLADRQADEFFRWRRAQPLATLQARAASLGHHPP